MRAGGAGSDVPERLSERCLDELELRLIAR
jgi:hypothetical protein